MGKNKYTYSYSKLVHNIPKPKQKAFAGAMTSIVKYVAENMVETIRFRSVSGDQGTVSSVKIQGSFCGASQGSFSCRLAEQRRSLPIE